MGCLSGTKISALGSRALPFFALAMVIFLSSLAGADPAPAPASEEKKTTTAKAKTGRALDPRAEIFVPGKRPKERAIPSREAEGKKMTTAKSRAGRPLRPPERFGARSL